MCTPGAAGADFVFKRQTLLGDSKWILFNKIIKLDPGDSVWTLKLHDFAIEMMEGHTEEYNTCHKTLHQNPQKYQ